MIEWIALGVAVFTLISWMITTYLSFIRNKPQLSISAPRYVERINQWHIYVYNEGNRATRMLEQYTTLIVKVGKKKVSISGGFRPEDRKEYFDANPGAYHHFYSIYEGMYFKKLPGNIRIKAKMLLALKYNNGIRTKLYKKKIKLDQDDVDAFIKNRTLDE